MLRILFSIITANKIDKSRNDAAKIFSKKIKKIFFFPIFTGQESDHAIRVHDQMEKKKRKKNRDKQDSMWMADLDIYRDTAGQRPIFFSRFFFFS